MIFPRQNGGLIPGGFSFQDPRVPAMIWSDTMFLPDRVSQVLKFRLANPQVYDPAVDLNELDSKHVEQEILKYNFARLGGSREHFITTGSELIDIQKVISGQPRCECKSELVPRYCEGCFVPKIISYQCPSCKKIFKT